MDELFYFPTFDLLIKILYSGEANSLRYATHRETNQEERKVIERYILYEVGPKTKYYSKSPSILLYMGVDKSLESELKFYQMKDTVKEIMHAKQEVDSKVSELISCALSNYYFEKVGDELIKLRQLIERGDSEQIDTTLNNIIILLEAYNENSGQEIDIENILPKEALSHFEHY